MDWKNDWTGPDCNQLGPIYRQLFATILWLHNNICKNLCENSLKTMILWVFTCIFNFFKDVLLYFILFCNVYTLTMHHMILYQQFTSEISFMCKNTTFNHFQSFSIVSSKYWSKPVSVAGFLFIEPKTILDRTCKQYL